MPVSPIMAQGDVYRFGVADHDPQCQRCGRVLDPTRLDVRFALPDPVFKIPEADRGATWGGDPLLQVDGVGAFVRCLLPVHLTEGMLLTFGTWLSVHPDDLRRAHTVWETADYTSLEIVGVLANAIRPWGDAVFAMPARIAVRNPEHIPYVVDTPDELLGKVIADEWNRDDVLATVDHALPVSIRHRITAAWSIERGKGFAARVHDGSLRLTTAGRTIIVDAHTTPPDQPFAAILTAALQGAPAAEGQLTEQHHDEYRHALWLAADADGRVQHELYGIVIRPGFVLRVACIHDDPNDRQWALDTWRSVRYHDHGGP